MKEFMPQQQIFNTSLIWQFPSGNGRKQLLAGIRAVLINCDLIWFFKQSKEDLPRIRRPVLPDHLHRKLVCCLCKAGTAAFYFPSQCSAALPGLAVAAGILLCRNLSGQGFPASGIFNPDRLGQSSQMAAPFLQHLQDFGTGSHQKDVIIRAGFQEFRTHDHHQLLQVLGAGKVEHFSADA